MDLSKAEIKNAAYTIYAKVLGNKAVDMILDIASNPTKENVNNVLECAEKINQRVFCVKK